MDEHEPQGDGRANEGDLPSAERLEALAGQLVWRIGRVSEEGPITVRMGLASSAPLFAELPRLRGATDAELQQALDENHVRVEWVGPRTR